MADKKEELQSVFARFQSSLIGRILSWPFRQLAKLFQNLFAKKQPVTPHLPSEVSANTQPTTQPTILPVSKPVIDPIPTPIRGSFETEAEPQRPVAPPPPSVVTTPVVATPTTIEQSPATVPVRRTTVVFPAPFADRPPEVQAVLEDLALRNFLTDGTVEILKTGTGDVSKAMERVAKDRKELERIHLLLKKVSSLGHAQQEQLRKEVSSLEENLNSLDSMTSARRKEIGNCVEKLSSAVTSAEKDYEDFKKIQGVHEEVWNLYSRLSKSTYDIQKTPLEKRAQQDLEKVMAALETELSNFYKPSSNRHMADQSAKTASETVARIKQEIPSVADPQKKNTDTLKP